MIKDGDTVRIHYTGKLQDGTVFDSSLEREPLEFTLGKGTVIPGLEDAIKDMDVGQSKAVTIPQEKAYGSHFDEKVLVIERDKLPSELNPAVGQMYRMQHQDGSEVIVHVIDVSETMITLDANHVLAGKDLTFEIEIVELK